MAMKLKSDLPRCLADNCKALEAKQSSCGVNLEVAKSGELGVARSMEEYQRVFLRFLPLLVVPCF